VRSAERRNQISAAPALIPTTISMMPPCPARGAEWRSRPV